MGRWVIDKSGIRGGGGTAAFVVGLQLQNMGYALANVVVTLSAGTILLIGPVKELASVAAFPYLENNEVRAAFRPK